MGAGVYVLLIGLSLRKPGKGVLIAACVSLVVCGAVWFVLVQALIIRQFCPWCSAIHALASAGALMCWWCVSMPGDASRALPAAAARSRQ